MASTARRDQDLKPVKDDSGKALYWVRWPADYFGADCDRGQILSAPPMDADHKLLRLKYLVPVLASDRPMPCRVCSEKFLDLNYLNAHGAKRHTEKTSRPDVPFSPKGVTVDENLGEVQRLEREQARAYAETPLDLEKTAAARR